MASATVVVVDYDETWPAGFEALLARVWRVVADLARRAGSHFQTGVPSWNVQGIIEYFIRDFTASDQSSRSVSVR